MRRFVFIWTLLLFSVALQSISLQLTNLSQFESKVDFILPEFVTTATVAEGIASQKISICGSESENWKDNLNGLPQTEQWVYVPNGFRAEISLQNPVITHRQNYICDTDDTIQTGQGWLDVAEPMRFRGNNLVSFVIKPFVYNKETQNLSILTTAEISIRYTSDSRYDCPDAERLYTPTTVQMLKAVCLNRDEIRESSRKPGSYVILYNGTTNVTTIQLLADWKHQKGFDVEMVNTATIGNTTTAIKSYLQTAYDTWANPPEFIFILGKPSGAEGVPTYSEFFVFNTIGDYKYTQLDGTDLIPDAYVGRATFSNSTELQTIINKTINYEKYSGLAINNWNNRALMVADPTHSGESCVTTINIVKDLILNFNPEAQFHDVSSGFFPTQMTQALNIGVSTFWYRGFAGVSDYSSIEINNLNNSGKFPFISLITCYTGDFSSATASLAELFLKAGTPGSPKGAIAVVGTSCETHTCTNNIFTGGMAHGFYVDRLAKAGPAMVRGKLAMLANFPQNPANFLNEYSQAINLLGDPAVDIWLKPPILINVTYPSSVYQSGGMAQIMVVDADGIPVSNAWVTLWKGGGELLETGYTNSNGLIVLAYTNLTAGNVKLTVTKPDFKTFQTNLAVIATPEPVNLQHITALDQCYAGSTITFPVSLTNNGTSLTNVTGILSTLDTDIDIVQANLTFGNISAGSTAISAQNCTIVLSSDMPKGNPVYLNLQINHSSGSINLPIVSVENGANLVVTSASFGNNLLSHGNNTLNLTLHNESSAVVDGLITNLQSTNPLVGIANPQQTLGTVGGNATITIPVAYNITVTDTLPEGVVVTLYLELSNTSGFQQRLIISKAIGSLSVNDITGPDSYGYICYGSGDEGYQAYNWIELDPALGGDGTVLDINDTDALGSGDYSTVPIPFTFRFYGMEYNQITICSNGYIMPGTNGSVEWMNWQIPGPMCPKPIIAPFWDDLLTDDDGRILYHYDPIGHAFIVQWQNLSNRYSLTQRETFQAVLYDPLFVTSPTGDSPILFQYKLFNNIDQGNYGNDYVDHGQYASVGIGDHTGSNGVEYTFNNAYPVTAQPLANFTTLYFTTLPNYIIDPNPIIVDHQISEVTGNGNGMIDAGELIDMSLTIRNTGMGTLNETNATLSTSDPYITIVQGQAILPVLYTNQMTATAPMFRLQVAQNCPNLHEAQLTLSLQNQLFTFPLTFNLSVNAISITMTDLHFTDPNDEYPAPGETVTMSFILTNVSQLNAQNVSVVISPPAGVSATPLSQVISLAPLAQQTLSYIVNVGSTVPQGAQLSFNLELNITDGYSQNFQLPILVGTPDMLFSTGFEEVNPYLNWALYHNVSITQSQYINLTGHEAVMYFASGTADSYARTNLLAVNDILGGEIRFKYFTSNPLAEFFIQVSYDDGQTFQTVWYSTGQTTAPREVVIPIENIPPAATSVSYMFALVQIGDAIQPIVVDDLEIKAVHHAPGIITGNVILDLFPENVSQATVQVMHTDIVAHPDAQGFYQIPAFAGINQVVVSLAYYNQVDQFITVSVNSGQTTSGHNISMQRLLVPINLTYTLEQNLLTLSWDTEGNTAREAAKQNVGIDLRNDRFLVPDYYKIWLRRNNITQHDTCSAQSYTRNLLFQGEYHIYIQSVYLFDEDYETYSLSSDTLTVVYTDNSDQVIQPVFALQQNSPNPFNPTTTIYFSVPVRRTASLVIYNLKGQVVKTLLNSEISAGSHSLIWNGCDEQNRQVGSGVYYYRLKTGKHILTRKMILLK